MKKNIHILKELQREITAFQLAEEEILLTTELEDIDIEDLIESGNEAVAAVTAAIRRIETLLDSPTEDVRNALDYAEFDCESYAWCVAKIQHSPFELANYMESFSGAVAGLLRFKKHFAARTVNGVLRRLRHALYGK